MRSWAATELVTMLMPPDAALLYVLSTTTSAESVWKSSSAFDE
jgi:hypothetical protein